MRFLRSSFAFPRFAPANLTMSSCARLTAINVAYLFYIHNNVIHYLTSRPPPFANPYSPKGKIYQKAGIRDTQPSPYREREYIHIKGSATPLRVPHYVLAPRLSKPSSYRQRISCPFHHPLSVSIVPESAILKMPTFADVYNNAPAPTVHSTRYPTKSSHPTSTSHIPADAKPIDFRRMSSSKAGMGRTRGTERSSKPEEAPVGPEFAERTRIGGASAASDGAASPPTAGSPSSPRKIFGAFEKRRASSGSPRESTSEGPLASEPMGSSPADQTLSPPTDESRTERRGSITNFFKKVF